MSTARDRVLIDELSRRGLLNEGSLSPVLATRPAELARALVQHQVVEPTALARVLAELGRAEYVCGPCGTVLRFADLAGLSELNCECGRLLTLRAESASRPPQRLGDYRLLHELGRGAMGVVYLAEREGLGRKFALKVIPQHVDRDTLERFRREAEVASRIAGDGVVSVYDVGFDSGRMFYAMEYVPGETLKDRLRAGPLRPREAATLVASLARTVASAHDVGVVHRDLKPSNVMLDAGGQARLADFGLAQDLSTSRSLTQTGWVLGTPVYMAPEQAEDSKRSGPAADVYALGAILYRCLTGEPPHASTDLMTLLERKRKHDPPPARSHDPEIPVTLERICQQALARTPAARPDAAALADALEGWLHRRRPKSSSRIAAGAGLAVALAAAAGIGYAATAWRGTETPPVPLNAGPAGESAPSTSPEPPAKRIALAQLDARVEALRREGFTPSRVLEELLSGRGEIATRAAADRLEVLIVEHFLRLCRMREVRDRAGALKLEDPHARRVLALLEALSYQSDQVDQGRRRLERLRAASAEDDVGLVAVCQLASLEKRPLPIERLRRRTRRVGAEAPLQRVTGVLLRIRWAQRLMARMRLDDAEAWLEELEATGAKGHGFILWARIMLANARRTPHRALPFLERLVAQAAPEVYGLALDQLAQARFNGGDGRGALAAMQRLLRLPAYARRLETHMNHGMMLRKLGARGESAQAWLRGARLDPLAFRRFLSPLGPRAPVTMGHMLEGLRYQPPDATPALQAAADALLRGVPQGADHRTLKQACLLAMRASPWSKIAAPLAQVTVSSAPVALVVARLQLGRDQLALAEASLERAARLGARGPALALLRVDLLRRRGRTTEARRGLEGLKSGQGDSGRLAGALGALLRRDLQRASSFLKQVSDAAVVERDALLAEVKLEQGDALLRRRSGAEEGDAVLLEGLFAVDRALARGAALNGRALAVRARLLTRLCFGWGLPNRYQGLGRAALEGALRLLPGAEHRIEAARQLARSPLPAGRPQHWAVKLLEQVLQVEPENPEAWWVRGMIAVALNEPAASALNCWRRARRLDPLSELPDLWRERFRRLHPAQAAELKAALGGG